MSGEFGRDEMGRIGLSKEGGKFLESLCGVGYKQREKLILQLRGSSDYPCYFVRKGLSYLNAGHGICAMKQSIENGRRTQDFPFSSYIIHQELHPQKPEGRNPKMAPTLSFKT